MKLYCLISFLAIFLLSCNSKTELKQYQFHEIGWTVKVPPGFREGNPEKERFSRAFTNLLGPEVKKEIDSSQAVSKVKWLIWFSKDFQNDFIANLSPCDSQKYNSICDEWKQFHAASFKYPELEPDTSMTHIDIDGVGFDVIELRTVDQIPGGKVNYSVSYLSWVNGYVLHIWIHYDDEPTGLVLKSIVKNSSFTHKSPAFYTWWLY